MPERLILYIDAQNTYRCARECFFGSPAPSSDGQFDPVAIANLICSRPPPGTTRTVEEVRVYTGRPDSTRSPRMYAAHMRQCASWAARGATVVHRPLRYLPNGRPQEKGIDVQLTIDFVAGAVNGTYDAGVIFSTDTDLRPALDFVADLGGPRAESAAWKAQKANRALRATPPRNTWCHYLDFSDYLAVQDRTSYV